MLQKHFDIILLMWAVLLNVLPHQRIGEVIKFKSSLLFPIVVALVSTSLALPNSNVEAAEVISTKEKKAEVTDEKWLQFEKDLESIQSQIGKIDKQAQKVESEIKQLDDEFAMINENIRNLEPIINTTKGEMDGR